MVIKKKGKKIHSKVNNAQEIVKSSMMLLLCTGETKNRATIGHMFSGTTTTNC